MPANVLEATETSSDFSDKVTEVAADDFKLTALDRCDRCGAQAYVEVTINESTLLFCSHHYKAKENDLLPLASVTAVWDESGRLHVKPPVTD